MNRHSRVWLPIRVDVESRRSVFGYFAPYDAPTNPIIPSLVGAAGAANLGKVEVWRGGVQSLGDGRERPGSRVRRGIRDEVWDEVSGEGAR